MTMKSIGLDCVEMCRCYTECVTLHFTLQCYVCYVTVFGHIFVVLRDWPSPAYSVSCAFMAEVFLCIALIL